MLRYIRAFGADNSGVTLTEFVLTLPVVIVIFAGIGSLGKLQETSVRVWARAHANTFDSLQEEKILSGLDDIVPSAGLNLNDSKTSKLLPPLAGGAALDQLKEYAIPQESTALRSSVTAAEVRAYSKLASDGHMGELEGRLEPLHRIGGFNYFGVSSSAVSPNTYQLMGIPGRGGSQIGSTLVYDGPSSFSSSFQGGEDCPGGLLAQVGSRVEQALSSGGIRPMLAAGIQYGTITGEPESEFIDMGMRQPPVKVQAYYNVTMPPRVVEADWVQPALTMMITRMALQNCLIAPYSELLKIDMGEQLLPSPLNWALDGVNDPSDVGIRHPLTYGGKEL